MVKSKRPRKRLKVASKSKKTSHHDNTDDEEEQELRQEMEEARNYSSDESIAVPSKRGVALSDEQFEKRLAFCCKICHCSKKVRASFGDHEYVIPGNDALWHRRCCHSANDVTEKWRPKHYHALRVMKKKLADKVQNGEPINPPTVATVSAKDVWQQYEAQKNKENEEAEDDIFDDQFDILEENESYERNLQYFQKKKIEIQKLGSSTREAVVVDLFGGIGSALVCLKRIGIAIRVVIHVDHDKIANVVYRHNHADDGIKHVIVEKLDEFEEKLDYLSEKYGPFNIVIGGPPNSKVNSKKKGPAAKQSSYVLRMGQLVQRLHRTANEHQCPFFFLAEAALHHPDTPRDIDEENELATIQKAFGVDWSLKLDSRHVSPLKRSRTYISNIPFSDNVDTCEISPRTCFDKGCTDECPERCEKCGRFDVPANLFETNVMSQAPELMSSKGRLDDSTMNIYLEKPEKSDELKFYCRTPTVVERERLLGLPEGYVWNSVDNLFTSLLQNGLDMYWQKPEVSGTLRNNWRHCLKKKYWEFAGDYHGFKGRWFPFRYSTSHDVLKLKLAPPVTGKKPHFFTAEEYGKRLLGNSFSIPTVVTLLQPIRGFFQHRDYPAFNYKYAWDNYKEGDFPTCPSQRVADMIQQTEKDRFAMGRREHAIPRSFERRRTVHHVPERAAAARAPAASRQRPEDEADDSSDEELSRLHQEPGVRPAEDLAHDVPTPVVSPELTSARDHPIPTLSQLSAPAPHQLEEEESDRYSEWDI